MRQALWRLLQWFVWHGPERLRLAFLEQPLIVPLDYGGLKIVAHGPIEYYVRSKSARKEANTVAWIAEFPKNSLFIDVGANVGAYSLIAAKMHPDACIVAVEPSPANYASLCRNVALNRASNWQLPIVTVPFQLTSYAEPVPTVSFHLQSWEPGAALHGTGCRIQTPACSLDWLVEQIGLWYGHWQGPTFIKIDVDGAERGVLQGARKTLAKAESVLIEIREDDSRQETERFIESFGLSAHSKIQISDKEQNWIFTRKEIR